MFCESGPYSIGKRERQTGEDCQTFCRKASNPIQVRNRQYHKSKLFQLFKWCPGAESNHRHEDFQSTALPLSYPGTGMDISIG